MCWKPFIQTPVNIYYYETNHPCLLSKSMWSTIHSEIFGYTQTHKFLADECMNIAVVGPNWEKNTSQGQIVNTNIA